jgi:hypothetical protein
MGHDLPWLDAAAAEAATSGMTGALEKEVVGTDAAAAGEIV